MDKELSLKELRLEQRIGYETDLICDAKFGKVRTRSVAVRICGASNGNE
jgi:hypothetical protein